MSIDSDPWQALRDDIAVELKAWDREAMSPYRMANELLDLVEHHGFDPFSYQDRTRTDGQAQKPL